jgi:TatA/E family protein of Tat protein translocase
MFDIGLQEMLVIGVLALLVFGPSKLPELGRMVGRALREFRRASDEFRSTVETNLHINDPDPIMPPAPPVETTSTALPSEVDPTIGDATVAADPKTAVAVEPGEPFCAQRGSKLLHKSDCSWVPRIPEAERAYFKHIADARDQGLLLCPVCEPWEPA